ncbi:MAG: hypothetical protein LBQ54_14100, partial [Planctomycetaceae bacterium]|nr:hypothetical protein [Planctomycetaceae bacterium]
MTRGSMLLHRSRAAAGGNARALHPGRLTLTSFGSPSVGEIFTTGGRKHTFFRLLILATNGNELLLRDGSPIWGAAASCWPPAFRSKTRVNDSTTRVNGSKARANGSKTRVKKVFFPQNRYKPPRKKELFPKNRKDVPKNSRK